MKLLLCFALAALVSLPAMADVNVTGNWTGTFTSFGPNGESEDHTALVILKQTGAQITGTLGPDEQTRYDIAKGSIDGNKIILELTEGDHTVQFNLTVDGDHMAGEAHTTTPDGQQMRAKLDVKRAK